MAALNSAQVEALESALGVGRALLDSDPAAAAAQADAILRADGNSTAALRLKSAALRLLGHVAEAEYTEMAAIRASAHNSVLVGSALAIKEGRWRDAEHLLRPYLDGVPDDAAALNMMGQIAMHVGAFAEAADFFRAALATAPSFPAPRLKLADSLLQQNLPGAALQILDEILRADPANFRARAAKAGALTAIGEFSAAAANYEQLLAETDDRPPLWMSYGHVLKTLGRLPDSIAAYRRAIALAPSYGEAWWSLANLKTATLGPDDIAAMMAALQDEQLNANSRLHLHFALGKAHEDEMDFERSFDHYKQANRLRAEDLNYASKSVTEDVDRSIAIFTPRFFADRQNRGNRSPSPVFIVGMPRAGSTLLEQILSSHSQVEGTSELPYIPVIAREELAVRWRSLNVSFPEYLLQLGPDEPAVLGDEYLRRAALHRKTNRPFFIDKLPNNWMNVGFIHLILPHAHIIDVRRHPLACCFSNFKQNFARGQAFSYSLTDLGRYYSDYVRMMAHFADVLPGRVHRVIYEDLIDDPEAQIRPLLAYLGLEFEEACLRFYENDRAVRTPSAEQVRRPINRSGLEQWKHFECWLDSLKTTLGPILDFYPGDPRQ